VRVLIDTTYALRGPSGAATYFDGLVPALRETGVDVVEAANRRRRPPGTGSLRNWLEDLRFTARELPRRARAAGADVLHHPLPAHARSAPCPQVVTVHDLAFERLPEAFDRRFAAWAGRCPTRRRPLRRAVIRPSEATARDVRARWGIAPDRIVVAPHGPGQALTAAPATPRHFLYVGDAEPRKNLATLRAAHTRYADRAPEPLPLVGSSGSASRVARRVQTPGSRPRNDDSGH
jgi:hypothetical protein